MGCELREKMTEENVPEKWPDITQGFLCCFQSIYFHAGNESGLRQGSASSGLGQYWSRPVENETYLTVVLFNHPETIPPAPQVRGKIVCHETGPWCHKGGRRGVKVRLLQS